MTIYFFHPNFPHKLMNGQKTNCVLAQPHGSIPSSEMFYLGLKNLGQENEFLCPFRPIITTLCLIKSF